MPFTNTWDSSTPVDGQLAKLLGADIRALKLDIVERLNVLLAVDFTADPLVGLGPRYLKGSVIVGHTLNADTSYLVTVACAGAAVGDLAVASWKGDGTIQVPFALPAELYMSITPWVSAPGVISILITNTTVTNFTLAAATLIAGILRPLP